MGQNKEDLGLILALCERLVNEPGNEDFTRGLQEIIFKSYCRNTSDLSHLLSCINTLVQEPGCDKFVDGLKSIIVKKYPQRVSDSDLDSYLRYQRDKFKRKARRYYQNVSNPTLKSQLIEDHARMLWYKSVDDVHNYFTYVNLQIENIVNYYLSKVDVHQALKDSPDLYKQKIDIGQKPMQINCVNDFIKCVDGKEVLVPYTSVKSLWTKVWFWAVGHKKTDWVLSQTSNFTSIINIRNEKSHRDSQSTKPGSSRYWMDMEDDQKYGFILKVLKCFRDSIE